MIIVSLPGDVGIGEGLSYLLGVQHREVTHKTFPDGETYLRLPWNVSDEDYILIQSTYPDQNRRIIELIMVARTLVRKGVRSLSAVIPYLAYARQDREFLPGEVVSVKVVLELLRLSGISSLYVVDIHKPEVLSTFKGSTTNIIPVNSFKDYIRTLNLKSPLIIAPDEGARYRALSLAQALGVDYLVIKKVRDRYTGKIVHLFPENYEFRGSEALIIDDIISTGGTIADIASRIRNLGVEKIFALATHGLFVDDAISRLKSAGVNEVIVAKTVGKVFDGVKYVSIVDEVANFIKGRFM